YMLDDLKYINQVDKSDALCFSSKQPSQLRHQFGITLGLDEEAPIKHTVFSGMGGSSLVNALITWWPQLSAPFVISKGYDLPGWGNENTLVICASYSGNTEETLAALNRATEKNAQVVIITHGGTLLECAQNEDIPYTLLPECPQPRTGIFYAYRAVLEILV